MASHSTPQTGQFNMSNHASMACHQPAPIPNMEAQSTIAAKRGPQEDVQFVSVQPVKKARGSRGSPPSQVQPMPQQQLNSLNSLNSHLQGQLHVKQAVDAQSSDTGVASASPSQTESSMQNRGVSFPGTESYAFPPPTDSTPAPSRTSRSSPILSPRQLPHSMLPPQPQYTLQAPSVFPAPGSGFRGLVPSPQFQVPWGMSALYPQPGPMHEAGLMSQKMHAPEGQPQQPGSAMDIDDQPLSLTTTLRRPESSRAPTPTSQPDSQRGPQIGRVASAHDGLFNRPEEPPTAPHAPMKQANMQETQILPPPGSPRQEETQSQIQPSPQVHGPSRVQTPSHAHDPSRAHTPPSTPNAGQPQVPYQTSPGAHTNHHTTGGHPVPTLQQGTPTLQQTAKGPCAICEQMRQQVLFNQANGLPTGHVPQMQHGWHGQGQMPQMHMGPLPPAMAAGYGMVPNMHQSFQQRYHQPVPLGPLGQLPLGYGLQSIPYQMPMHMQRQAAVANTPGAEPPHNGLPLTQQVQQSQEQHTPAAQVFQFVSASGQPLPPQYVQSQLQPIPQPSLLQRPMIMHPQALAPPTPPTSSEQPPAADSSNLQAPQHAQPASSPTEPPKEHSPNLIVDIAETCEELFPWDEVAQRHGATRVKVVETFGAIIQLPLLRCTGDKKKHGKLATSRLREYTKAKKDAEAQNAAEAANAAARAKKKTPKAAAPAKPAAAAQKVKPQAAQAQAQAYETQANQSQSQATQDQAAQMHTAQAQAQAQNQMMQAQAAMHANQVQNQAMQAQTSQMLANQSHLNQGYPQQLQPGQPHGQQQDTRPHMPGIFDMVNSMSPLGLPSNHTNGLPGPWQQQPQPQQQQQRQ